VHDYVIQKYELCIETELPVTYVAGTLGQSDCTLL